MKLLNDTAFLEVLKNRATGSRLEYKAFYSSFLGGITTETHHMIVPLDDHMVHRGDAVFEAMKFTDAGIYALDRHLERLEVSAANIALKLSMSRAEFSDMIIETVRASGLREGIIRLFVSRGPGGFTTNPFETTGTQVYCAITTYKAPAAAKYENGVVTMLSSYAVKEGFFARTKTCNYLPNVLMKKESLDRGVDFVVTRDEDGYLAEGSTENFAIIAADGKLVMPTFDRILKGITAVRALELAKEIGIGSDVRRFREDEVKTAKGAVMMGTTIDILPVQSFENHKFGAIPAETTALRKAFAQDLASGPLLTAY